MKHFIFLLLFAGLFSVTLPAQQHGGKDHSTPEQQAERKAERLHKELKLTDKQKSEIKDWYTQMYQKRRDEIKKSPQEREAMLKKMQERMKKDREETDVFLKKILTPEQYKKYQENEQKHEKEMRERMKQRKPE